MKRIQQASGLVTGLSAEIEQGHTQRLQQHWPNRVAPCMAFCSEAVRENARGAATSRDARWRRRVRCIGSQAILRVRFRPRVDQRQIGRGKRNWAAASRAAGVFAQSARIGWSPLACRSCGRGAPALGHVPLVVTGTAASANEPMSNQCPARTVGWPHASQRVFIRCELRPNRSDERRVFGRTAALSSTEP
jgi:hypothetical protein